MSQNSILDAQIFDRVVSRGGRALSRHMAEEILSWDFVQEDLDRMRELSAKVRAGELSTNEEAELDSYVRV
jgi:hypothetical protein